MTDKQVEAGLGAADIHKEAGAGTPEIDWPCDFPTPHSPHQASAYDDMGILVGYTEWCHGGTDIRKG